MNSWSQRWHLHFNSSKFRLIQFHLNTASSSNTDSYIINGQTIESSTSHKDLGILLTDTLNWEEHYHCISLRAYRQLGLLWRTFRSTQVSAKKELYLSLVRSQLAYCSPIWRRNQIQHIILLEKVQHHATKFILSNSSLDYKARLVSLHLLPLMSWLELADIVLLVKHIKYPDNRLIIFDHITFSTSRTRSSTYCKLSYKRSRTIKFRHFYFNRVCRLWNELPPIDLSHSIMSIKKDVKDFLWSNFINNFNSDFPSTFYFMCPCSKCMIIPLQTSFS